MVVQRGGAQNIIQYGSAVISHACAVLALPYLPKARIAHNVVVLCLPGTLGEVKYAQTRIPAPGASLSGGGCH